MESFMGSYVGDIQVIDEELKNVGKHRSSLEAICASAPENISAEKLASAYTGMRQAIELGEKYSQFKGKKEGAYGAGKLFELVRLKEDFYGILGDYTGAVFKRWEIGKGVVENWSSQDNFDGLKDAKQELEALAESYSKISGFAEKTIKDKDKQTAEIMDRYICFAKERGIFDSRLEGLRHEIESGEFRSGRMEYAKAELNELEKKYSSLAKQHSSLRCRIIGKHDLFDCREQLEVVSRLYGIFEEKRRAIKNGSTGEEAKLLDSWMKIYKSALGRISGAEEITPDYVEELCGTELADMGVTARAENEPSLSKKLGGFMELDSVVRSQLERELSRVEAELDKREQILEEELREPDYMQGNGQKDNIEFLLAASYELSRMRKRCCLSSERTKDTIKELKRRLMVDANEDKLRKIKRDVVFNEDMQVPPTDSRNSREYGGKDKRGESRERRDNRGESRELYLEERFSEDLPSKSEGNSYRGIIQDAKNRLAEISARHSGAGIMEPDDICELFLARDSLYGSLSDSIGKRGGRMPVEEVEGMIRDIYAHDKEEIDRFVARNNRKNLDEKKIRQAAYYRKIIDEWEMRLNA